MYNEQEIRKEDKQEIDDWVEKVMKKIRPINSKYAKQIAGVINEHDQRLIDEAQREILTTEPIKTLLEKLKEADGDLERITVEPPANELELFPKVHKIDKALTRIKQEANHEQ